MTDADRAEQALVRRVVTGVCVLALLTVPVVHWWVGTSDGRVGVAHLVALALGFAVLGRTRIGLAPVVAALGTMLFLVLLMGVGSVAAATFRGESEGVGLGTAVLWLAAGYAPVLTLAVPLRRAAAVAGAALVTTVLVVAAAAGWQWAALARHPGVTDVLLDIAVVLTTTGVVAWRARRSAVERHRAAERQAAAAARVADLELAQQQRAQLLSRTALQLRAPMTDLVTAASLVRQDGDTGDAAGLARVESLARGMLDRVVEELDAAVERLHVVEPAPAATPTGQPRRRPRWRPLLLAAVVTGLVALDAIRVARLLSDGLGDPVATAMTANRLIPVLFVAAATLVLAMPGRRGWFATGAVLLLHPLTVVLVAPDLVRELLLGRYLSSWRIGLLASATLALLAEVIRRRVDERERLDRETASSAAAAEAQVHRDALAQRSYAEAAHELKNPLAVISGSAGLLLHRDTTLAPEQATALRAAIVRGIGRLDERLVAMEDAAGVGAGPGRRRGAAALSAHPAPVAEVLTRALTSALDGLEPRPVLEIDDLEGDTLVAPGALQHVLENLLGNAAKHGDAGTTRLTGHRVGEEVVVAVANRGGALGPDEAARVFEPYWRAVDSETDVEGAGLGLAIVARLVGEWGGRCWATVEDGWTTVGVALPVLVGSSVGRPLEGQSA